MSARPCAAPGCAKPVQSRRDIAIYCTPTCAKRARRHQTGGAPKPLAAIPCAWPDCDVTFVPGSHSTLYCSDNCRRLGKNAWARGHKARSDGKPKGTHTSASVARAGIVRREASTIRWTPAVGPQSSAGARAAHEAAMEAAREAFARAMAAVPKRAGRPKGVKVSA